MKKIVFAAFIALGFTLCSQNTQAQAWEKSSKVLSLGLGGSDFVHIYSGNAYYGWGAWNAPLTGQFNFQGAFGVHDYVGIGFTTGIGGRGGYWSGYAGEINVPAAVLANFHFYQLIADKTGKDIHSDKLDIYEGVALGAGVAAQFFNNGGSQVVPIVIGGVHAGVRYYFTDKFGVNGEIGTPYGKGFIK